MWHSLNAFEYYYIRNLNYIKQSILPQNILTGKHNMRLTFKSIQMTNNAILVNFLLFTF